ncbi:Aspartate/methionine/tyrosine aminotransferase [Desulfocicer vacuolatum DSM 3385]|uniref:Aspartate/methionine/tyrosine aminotransferase n=1 Tax=Desulfocicer vacuolatum DSM 3385 TaxID=1121400 RepID=A0A1W2B7W7_9BACT|nr:pyridoxal phosphate-dependent aminotransferase [Desulfocicer vacuolatum]SMC68468.1 Aspartate/methionine/tyrosine aminotransferase [Desulfocicer vacuolatum DSM 3385]
MITEFKNQNTPVDFGLVKEKIKNSGVPSIGNGTIREIVKIANEIQQASGEKFVRMEMGVPGLAPPEVGIHGEIEALKNGVAAKYPMLEGILPLKKEASRFIKMFMDVDVPRECCIPTVGSMQGGYASFMILGNMDTVKNTILFMDPGFPVQKQQLNVLGRKYEAFDVYNHRGDKLEQKLESYLSKGNISAIVYSNPNNPSWICLNEDELQTIAKLADKYDVIVIEDLAYFAMDFRKDLSMPGRPPFQPTVAKYTNNYILLISSSKAFSYAGQRVGLLVISPDLYHRQNFHLKERFGSDKFGYTLIYKILYSFSSGTSHSAQYGLAAMLKAANDGDFNFVESVRVYGERAVAIKTLFKKAGFDIVYSMDLEEVLGDGFYFTVSFPGMTGAELVERLLYYGISAIALSGTGSDHEGMRVCMSQIGEDELGILAERLEQFGRDYQ